MHKYMKQGDISTMYAFFIDIFNETIYMYWNIKAINY